MKRMFLILGIAILVICIALLLCGPIIESYQPEPQFYSGGYAHTKGIMEGLCLGNTETCYGVIFRERAVPDLAEKLESFCELVNGRLYRHIATVDFTVEGDYPNAPWSETSYMEIRMEDGSCLYAIVVFLQEAEGCGVTDFDLFTQCPWQ